MDKIKELKDLLFELDSKHSVSVSNTHQNINDTTKKIVELFSVIGRFSELGHERIIQSRGRI